METNDSPEQFLEKYLALCANPLRNNAQLTMELRQLIALPMVKNIVFARAFDGDPADTLVVLLDELVLTDPATQLNHFIGNFAVFLTRKRNGRSWVSRFRLVNFDTHSAGKGIHMHPHMRAEIDPHTKEPRAAICISRGQQPIYQAIRFGEMHLATMRIIDVLRTLGPNHPYSHISQWPLWSNEHVRI